MDESRDLNQSVTRAAMVLDLLASSDRPLPASVVARRLGLARPTAHRLLTTLAETGAVLREARGYSPGPALLRWGQAYSDRNPLLSKAPPVLEALRDATLETAYLFIRQGALRVCIAKADSPQSLRRFVEVGMTLPLHAGSAGKALLSGLGPEELDEALPVELQRYTPHTLADREALVAELARIQTEGVAISVGEREEGLASISAPVSDATGRTVAAVGISGPASRFGEANVRAWRGHVRRAADRLGAALGATAS